MNADLTNMVVDLFGQVGEIEVCQGHSKNKFCFDKEDVSSFLNHSHLSLTLKIIGISYDEEFILDLGEAYFFFQGSPCCCYISQIDSPHFYYRDYNAAVILIDINQYAKIKTFTNLTLLFKSYQGEVVNSEVSGPVESRFEILDL